MPEKSSDKKRYTERQGLDGFRSKPLLVIESPAFDAGLFFAVRRDIDFHFKRRYTLKKLEETNGEYEKINNWRIRLMKIEKMRIWKYERMRCV